MDDAAAKQWMALYAFTETMHQKVRDGFDAEYKSLQTRANLTEAFQQLLIPVVHLISVLSVLNTKAKLVNVHDSDGRKIIALDRDWEGNLQYKLFGNSKFSRGPLIASVFFHSNPDASQLKKFLVILAAHYFLERRTVNIKSCTARNECFYQSPCGKVDLKLDGPMTAILDSDLKDRKLIDAVSLDIIPLRNADAFRNILDNTQAKSIVIVGDSNQGKSVLANALTSSKAFKVGMGGHTTDGVTLYSMLDPTHNQRIHIYDTPGNNHANHHDVAKRCMDHVGMIGCLAFLIVKFNSAPVITTTVKKYFELAYETFGSGVSKNILILGTLSDDKLDVKRLSEECVKSGLTKLDAGWWKNHYRCVKQDDDQIKPEQLLGLWDDIKIISPVSPLKYVSMLNIIAKYAAHKGSLADHEDAEIRTYSSSCLDNIGGYFGDKCQILVDKSSQTFTVQVDFGTQIDNWFRGIFGGEQTKPNVHQIRVISENVFKDIMQNIKSYERPSIFTNPTIVTCAEKFIEELKTHKLLVIPIVNDDLKKSIKMRLDAYCYILVPNVDDCVKIITRDVDAGARFSTSDDTEKVLQMHAKRIEDNKPTRVRSILEE